MDQFNKVAIPVYELDTDGYVLPNPIFHRSWDKLHSRCIEYPFAASKVDNAQVILDVGTAKADRVWIRWLDSLPIEVHATDYDPLNYSPTKLIFHQSDIRNLPTIGDNTFDKILAVSVIEHIGLENPQVNSQTMPSCGKRGDLDGFCELVRVLKRGGEIVMTFPFGNNNGLILNGSARNYTIETIKRFEKYAQPVTLDYYEYQYSRYKDIYLEYLPEKSKVQKNNELFGMDKRKIDNKITSQLPSLLVLGLVTWRRIPMQNSRATQIGHIDGVLCGVWRKD
jgi:SAM-dependent methyltransferase